MKRYVIIVAGGKGLRMGADLPKQFLPIGGKPVLMHTLERFRAFDPAINIILVLPHEQQDYWQKLCREYGCTVTHHVADGGESRCHSSFNGLRAIPDDVEEALVGIHDGVRPFPSPDTLRRCYDAAGQTGAVIPVLPVVDTLRQIGKEGTSSTVPRSNYRIVQTPQVFRLSLLRAAFRKAFRTDSDSVAINGGADTATFTDDASVVEAYGHAVTLVEGNRENIKLTTPFDLTIAEALLKGDT